MGEIGGHPTEIIREGAAELEVPIIARRRGPGARTGVPFYNPTTTVSRDITVALMAALPPPGAFLDGLAATGVTAIRVALEAGTPDVVLNDANPLAAELARRNAVRNRVDVRVEERKLQALLAEQRFSHVDIDPFGTPLPYVDGAVRSLSAGGRLSVTATDVATLGGVHPATALRRYEARVARSAAIPEIAVRVLLGVLTRAAARYDLGSSPVCAFAVEHIVRAHVQLRPGASIADATLTNLGAATPPVVTGGVPGTTFGPLWLGPLGDSKAVGDMEDRAPSAVAGHLLGTIRRELGLPPFYFHTEDLARAARVSVPPVDAILAGLRGLGFRAERTHFDRTALKSDAPLSDILRVVSSLHGQIAEKDKP